MEINFISTQTEEGKQLLEELTTAAVARIDNNIVQLQQGDEIEILGIEKVSFPRGEDRPALVGKILNRSEIKVNFWPSWLFNEFTKVDDGTTIKATVNGEGVWSGEGLQTTLETLLNTKKIRVDSIETATVWAPIFDENSSYLGQEGKVKTVHHFSI